MMEEVVNTYREIASIPNVVYGHLLGTDSTNEYVLESGWQQKDLEKVENVVFRKFTHVNVNDSEINVYGNSSIPSVMNKEILVKHTNCGKMKAVIRETTDKDKNKVQFIEIWDKFKKISITNLHRAEKHGIVNSDIQFGCLEWSKDNSKILYVAETKTQKSMSYFKPVDKDDKFERGNEHVWKECWREQLTEAIQPTICVFDVSSQNVSVYSDIIPENTSPGQAIWNHDCESIIFVGWKNGPYKLGLSYTTTRENHLYLLNIKQKVCMKLTPDDISVRSPRLHPTDNLILFLKNPVGGPHFYCTELASINIPSFDEKVKSETPNHRVIINQVHVPESKNDFPGLYLLNLPHNCWSKDGQNLLLASFWRSHCCILDINIIKGSIRRLTYDGFSIILEVKDDLIVIGYSTPTKPPEIRIAKFVADNEVKWTTIEQPCEELLSLKWSVHSFVPDLPNTNFINIPCEYILYQQVAGNSAQNSKMKSLIVNPHGGPHTLDVTAFVHEIAALCQLGFTVVQVNYRGSIGFGQSSIDSLPGNIGSQDVSDVHQVAKLLKNTLGIEKVFVQGLSHGGFLTLQLISQFPDFYSAACVKNAVTNLASMANLTDLEDWPPWEVESEYFKYTSLPSKESYAAMLSKSPICHIENAKAPCLVMVGKADLRVPPSQGKQWAMKYKALGKTCKILEYEDNNHFLDGIEAESDGFVNMVLWFKKYGK